MFGIHWRFHGTIGPAVLKSTFFVPPGCQNSIPGNIFIVAEVLAPCLPCSSLPAAPVHPCLFPSLLASARPPDSGPADRCESSGAFFIRPGKQFWAILGSPGVIPGGPPCPPFVIGTKLRPSTPPSLQPSTLPPFPSLHPSARPSLYPIHPFTPSRTLTDHCQIRSHCGSRHRLFSCMGNGFVGESP